MSWKLVVLVGFVIIGGAIITASAKPWESSGGSSGPKITSWATCLKAQAEQRPQAGPSLRQDICQALGWHP